MRRLPETLSRPSAEPSASIASTVCSRSAPPLFLSIFPLSLRYLLTFGSRVGKAHFALPGAKLLDLTFRTSGRSAHTICRFPCGPECGWPITPPAASSNGGDAPADRATGRLVRLAFRPRPCLPSRCPPAISSRGHVPAGSALVAGWLWLERRWAPATSLLTV
jgi:hypothetical protein